MIKQRSENAYYSPIRDMKQFSGRAYLADNGAASVRWRNTERRLRRVVYDDGGVYEMALSRLGKGLRVYDARGG